MAIFGAESCKTDVYNKLFFCKLISLIFQNLGEISTALKDQRFFCLVTKVKSNYQSIVRVMIILQIHLNLLDLFLLQIFFYINYISIV